jgi:hypothetical protein
MILDEEVIIQSSVLPKKEAVVAMASSKRA